MEKLLLHLVVTINLILILPPLIIHHLLRPSLDLLEVVAVVKVKVKVRVLLLILILIPLILILLPILILIVVAVRKDSCDTDLHPKCTPSDICNSLTECSLKEWQDMTQGGDSNRKAKARLGHKLPHLHSMFSSLCETSSF